MRMTEVAKQALRREFNQKRMRLHPAHKKYLAKHFPKGVPDALLVQAHGWADKALLLADERKRGIRRHEPIRKDEFTKDWYFEEAQRQEPGITREEFEKRWPAFQMFIEQIQNQTIFEVKRG